MGAVSRREKPKTTPPSDRKEGDAMQEKTVKLIIKAAEIAIGIAILIKEIFGGGKHDDSGTSKKK